MENSEHQESMPDRRAPAPPEPESGDLDREEQPSRLGRWAQLAARLRRPAQVSRDAKSTERTRGLVVLAGATLACLFLFFGLFTTQNGNRKERSTKPNLGRPEAATVNLEAANRSPVPQLSVNPQPNEESGELDEKDLLGTMRNRGSGAPKETRPTPPQDSPPSPNALNTVNFDDPALADAYRKQNLALPPRRTEIVDWNAAIADYEAKQKAAPLAPPLAAAPAVSVNESLRKSSIVFVRSSLETEARQPAPAFATENKRAGLLPQGTALVARLQQAVTSAAKTPVTAIIEYNYEQDGQLIVPAGTKAYGELAQATPQGIVTIKFHTLEFPDGEQEKIDGSAVSMERSALRGDVNGKNGVKKFLTRTLTGIGSIAAFAVGGQGLSGNLNNSALLRDRISSNVGVAGEQELDTLAYQQNIVVTVPANTRFYLVLNQPSVNRPAAATPPQPTASAVQQASVHDTISDQELREIIELRNELREMNQMMQLGTPKVEPSPLENP